MMEKISINEWDREDVFRFFCADANVAPVGCVTVRMDCTRVFQLAKERGDSFFLYYTYPLLKLVNELVNYRYRLSTDQEYVELYDCIGMGVTVAKDNHQFGFARIPYTDDFSEFMQTGRIILDEAKNIQGMNASPRKDLIYITTVPKMDFTSLVFNRSGLVDIPRFAFGKCVEQSGRRSMSLAIQYHHGFIDGYHLGELVEKLQDEYDRCDFVR